MTKWMISHVLIMDINDLFFRPTNWWISKWL